MRERPIAEILVGKEGEERLLVKSVGGRPPRRASKKKRKAGKREFQTVQKETTLQCSASLGQSARPFRGKKSGIPATKVSEYTPKKKDKASMSSKIYRPSSMARGVWPWGGLYASGPRLKGSTRLLIGGLGTQIPF